MNGLVEANGRTHLGLQFGMIENVIPGERLLNHHEVVSVEFPQVSGLFQMVCGIRIRHEPHGGKALANRGDKFQILARFDFDFDALITCRQFPFDHGKQGFRIGLYAQRDAASDLSRCTAEQRGQRGAAPLRLDVPQSVF